MCYKGKYFGFGVISEMVVIIDLWNHIQLLKKHKKISVITMEQKILIRQ